MKRAHTPDSGPAESGAEALTPSGFELRLAEGRAFIEGSGRPLGEGVAIRRFSMEIPSVRFPFDVTGGADRFRDQRCVLRELELRVEASAVERWLPAALNLGSLGIERLQVAFRPDCIELQGELSAAGPFTVKAGVEADQAGFSLLCYELRLYRPVPLCSALLLHRLAGSARGEEDPLAPLPGSVSAGPLGSVRLRCDPLPVVLRQLLVGRGYKLPDARRLRLAGIELGSGHAVLTFQVAGAPSPSGLDHLTALEGGRSFAEIERFIAEGELSRARSELLAASATGPSHPFAAERLLQLLAADPAAQDLAIDLCALWRERNPPLPAALWVEAVARQAQGDLTRAAALFCELAERSLAVRELFSAGAAASAAAELAMQAHDDGLAQRALSLRQAASPEDLEVLADVAEVAERRGDLPAALSALRRVAAFGGEGERAARAHARLGRLLLAESRDLPRARLHLDRALQLDPDDRESLEALAEACQQGGEDLRALRLFDRAGQLAESEGETLRAAQLALRSARLWEERLLHAENALLRYREALRLLASSGESTPLYLEAAAGTAALCERLGLWTEAMEAQLKLSEHSGPGRKRAEAQLALSRLLSHRLSDPAAADHSARAALEEDPTFAEAAAELCRLRRGGPPRPLAEALRLAANLTAHGPEQADLLAELARLQLRELRDAASAREVFEEALRSDPHCVAAVEGAVEAAETDAAALVFALERWAAILPQGLERQRTLRRLADAAESLGELERAARALVDATADPEAPPELLDRLLSLHRRRGDVAAAMAVAEQLADVLTARDNSAAAVAVLLDQVEAALRVEGASTERIAALLAGARALAPEDTRVLQWEVALARRSGDPAATRSALMELLAAVGAGEDRGFLATAQRQLADACRELGKLEEAVEALDQSFTLEPSETVAEQLVDGYLELGRPRERALALEKLALVLEAAERPAGARWFEAAHIWSELEPDRAVSDLERAASGGGALGLDAHRALADLHLARGEREKAAAALELWAEGLTDRQDRARAYREVAEVAGEGPRLKQALHSAIAADPDDAWSSSLIALLELSGGEAYAALAASERVLAAEGLEADAERRDLLEAVAVEACRVLGEADRELSHLDVLVHRRPNELLWLRRKVELLQGAPALAAEALETLAERLSGHEAVVALCDLGDLRLELEQLPEASEAFLRALEHEPNNPRALSRAVLAVPRDPVERRIELLWRYLEVVAPASAPHLAELATLLEPLDRQEALRVWTLAAEASPTDLGLASSRADLLETLELWREAASARGTLAEARREAGDATWAEEALRAATAALRAEDFAGAAASAERGLQAGDAQLASPLWCALAEARHGQGDRAGEAQALGEAVAHVPRTDRGPLSRRRAALLRELGDREGERDALTQALVTTPRDISCLVELKEACLALADFEGACDALETLVLAWLPNRSEAASAALELGRIAQDSLGSVPRAEAAYRRSLTLDPTRRESSLRLGELRIAAGEVREGLELLAAAIEQLGEAERPSARVALARRASVDLLDHEFALAQARKALAAAPQDSTALRLTVELLYQAGAVGEALPLLERLADAPWEDEPEGRERVVLWLAEVRAAAGDLAGARAVLAELLAARPHCEAAREQLADLCGDLADSAAVELWVSLADSARAPRLRADYLTRAGRRLLSTDPAAAAGLFQRALQDRDSAELRAELRAALAGSADFESLSDAWVAELERARTAQDAAAEERALRELAQQRRRAQDPEGHALVLHELGELLARTPAQALEAGAVIGEAAILWEGEQNVSKALEAYQRALGLGATPELRWRAAALCRAAERPQLLAWLLEEGLPALPSDEARAEALLELFDLYVGPLGSPEKGEPALRRALELAPDLAGAEERLRGILASEGRRAELGAFLVWRAQRAEAIGRPEAAGRLFAAAADELVAVNDTAAAAEAMTASARTLPSPESTLRAADLRHEAGDVAGAGQLYGQLLYEAPLGAPRRAVERRAEALRAGGDAQELAAFLEQGAEAGPAPAAWWAEAAAVWQTIEERGSGEAAEAALRARRRCERKAFETNPADAHFFAAVVGGVEAADPDAWARLLRSRAAAVPSEAPGLNRALGEVFLTARRMQEAAAAFDVALAASPDDALALVGRAEAGAALGESVEPLALKLKESLRSLPDRRPEHAEATFRMGALLSEEGRFALACDFLELALEILPSSHHAAEALRLLDQASTAQGDWQRQLDVRSRRWRQSDGEARRLALSSLLEVLRPEHADAVQALREAVAGAPESTELGGRLAEACEVAEDWSAAAAELEKLATRPVDQAASDDAGSVAQTLRIAQALRAAELFSACLADGESALRMQELALRLAAGSVTSLRTVAAAFDGGPPELLDRALAELAAALPEAEGGEVLLRRAKLAETGLGAAERRRAWEAVLSGGATSVGREAALEWRLDVELSESHAREALQTLLELAELAATGDLRAERLQRAARIAEEDLADASTAIALLRRAAEEVGGTRGFTLLAEACDRAGRAAEAAAAMEVEVSLREAGERKRERQRKLGLLLARDLGRSREALPHLQAAWKGGAGDAQLLEALADSAEAAGDDPLQLLALEAIPAETPGAGQRARRRAILLEKLDRPAEATDAWRRAFMGDPADAAAFDGLVHHLEDRKGWEELSDVLRRRAEAVAIEDAGSRDLRADLLARQGELLARELGDSAAAERAYREALALQPGHRDSVSALAGLCEARGATAEAAELLAQELKAGGSPAVAATVGLRLGKLHLELGDATAAEAALREALERSRGTEELALVGEIQGALGAALLTLDQPEEALLCAKAALAGAPVADQVSLLGVCAEASARLGWADQARAHWREILSLQPGNPTALGGLEALARTQGPEMMVEALSERAKAEADPARRAQTLLDVARLCLDELHDDVGGEAALRSAVEAAPDEPEAFSQLRRLLERQGKVEELVDALRLRARHATADDTRAEAFRDQGEILRVRVRDLRRAAEAYSRAIGLRPQDAVSAEGLAECLLGLGQGDRAVEYYRRALSGGGHLGEFFLHYRLGQIAERAGQAEQALEHYQASIAANPAFLPAPEAAAQVADGLGRIDVAVSILRGVLAVLDPAEFAAQVAGVLLRIGELEKRSLHFEAAIEAFERSSELGPTDPKPLRELAFLYQNRARWSDASRVLLKLQELVDAPAAATALVEAAVINLDKLADMATAADLLERALALEPTHGRALQRLAEICAALGRHERLLDIASRVAPFDPPWLDELSLALADAYQSAGRFEDAYQAVVRARSAAPKDAPLLERQLALADKTGRMQEQLDLEEQIIQLSEAERPLEAATRLRALARRAASLAQDPERGERLLVWAEELAPARPEDRRMLADLRRRRPETASKAAAGYLDLLRQSWPPAPDLLRALGATAAAIGEADLARSALGLAGVMAGEPAPLPPAPRPLPEDVWRALPLPPESPFEIILAELAPLLEGLFPADLRRFGLAPADRLGPGRTPQVLKWVEDVREGMRARPVQVFLVAGLDVVALENGQPPCLIVGGGPLATLGAGPMQFLIAQRLALVELGLTLPSKFSARDCSTLARLLAAFLHPAGLPTDPESDRLRPFLAALQQACPAAVKERLGQAGAELARDLSSFDPREALNEGLVRAGKLALWATGDLPGALAAQRAGDPSVAARGVPPWETSVGQTLARWAFSAEYLSLRAGR